MIGMEFVVSPLRRNRRVSTSDLGKASLCPSDPIAVCSEASDLEWKCSIQNAPFLRCVILERREYYMNPYILKASDAGDISPPFFAFSAKF